MPNNKAADLVNQPSSCLDAALQYAIEYGWFVFPVPPGTKKSYISENDPRYNGEKWGRTRDPEEIKRYWREHPEANVGVVTGRISGIFVVDVDTKEGGHAHDGLISLRELEQQHGKLPATRIAISPSGSLHYYFKHPGGRIVTKTLQVAPGIDIKGDGGIVVAPPSMGNGGLYQWRSKDEIVAAPLWLLALIFDQQTDQGGGDGLGNPEKQADIELVRLALAVLPNGPEVTFDQWTKIGLAVYAATAGAGFALFDEWSRKWPGYKEAETKAAWARFRRSPPTRSGAGTLFWLAGEVDLHWRSNYDMQQDLEFEKRFQIKPQQDFGHQPPPEEPPGTPPLPRDPSGKPLKLNIETDFIAYSPEHTYIFRPTGAMWPAATVNSRIKLKATKKVTTKGGKESVRRVLATEWLDQNRAVEQMTWAPGWPQEIKHWLIDQGGWFDHPNATVYNIYRPPSIKGIPGPINLWSDHIVTLFGLEAAQHIIKWFAHRVQFPGEKINHSLVFGGHPNIGKDTILTPLRYAIGPWNFGEISPKEILGRFNEWRQRAVLRVSEAADLGDIDRFRFYDACKILMASPPEVLRVDAKNIREYMVPNVVGIIITTNHRTNGIYLPPDDRRHFVVWSDKTREDFDQDYWDRIWDWYDERGSQAGLKAITHYLATLDLSNFNPKEPPPKTEVFWDIVATNQAPEDVELATVLDNKEMKPCPWPIALTLDRLIEAAGHDEGSFDFGLWLRDRRNARKIPHRLESCGYVRYRNPNNKRDGSWPIRGKHQIIYVKSDAPMQDVFKAIEELRDNVEPIKSAF